MSQIQVQAPAAGEEAAQSAPEPAPELVIFTWGSCRRGYLEIVYPKRINLEPWTRREGVHEVEIPGVCRIRYENRDSSKNLHRYVEILDVYTTIVVRNYGSRSCSHSFERVYIVRKENNGVVYEEPEVKTEVAVEEHGKYKITIEKRFVEVNGVKAYIDARELDKEVCMEKLKVTLRRESDKIIATGDTYHIRETLKKYGMRWDPASKTWHTTVEKIDVNELVLELEQLGVQVEVQ
jgi:NACalpha-BTF3-like transcription factor